jgi:hypothetical protein
MRIQLLMQHVSYSSNQGIASNLQEMHTISMRTTVTLDDDAYELAMLRAKGKRITLGAALSESIREAHEARLQDKPLPEGLVRGPKGMLMFAPRKDGRILTTEMVKTAMLKQEEEDDERKAFPARRQHSRRVV